jgi:hypothetical protein
MEKLKVKVVIKNGWFRDLPNLPPGICVFIYDYDLDKYGAERQEPDHRGKPCVASMWSRAGDITHTVRLGIHKRKAEIIECPNSIIIEYVIE